LSVEIKIIELKLLVGCIWEFVRRVGQTFRSALGVKKRK